MGVENIPTGPRLAGGMEKAMKIGQQPELSSAVAQSNASKQAKTAALATEASAKAPASAAAAGVPVTLSRTAREIEQTGRNQSDFDAGRVKAAPLKTALSRSMPERLPTRCCRMPRKSFRIRALDPPDRAIFPAIAASRPVDA